MLPLLISLAFAAALLFIIVGAISGTGGGKKRDELRSRLLDEGAAQQGVTDAQIQASIRRDMGDGKHGWLNRALKNFSITGNLESLLIQSRSNARPGDVIIKCAILAAIGFFTFSSSTGYAASGLVGGAIFAVLPIMHVIRKKNKRMAEFSRQLPDSMTMIKNALRAGHTLGKAMAIVSEEMPAPLGTEFRDTVEELRLGLPLTRAMGNLATRMPNDSLNIFVAAVLIQHEVGGNLTELLDNISRTIRERFRLEAEVKSLTAEGRISGIVIAVLPIALCLIISLMQPEYLMPLFDTEQGNKLLMAAMCSETIGFIWIRRVCKVKF